MLVYYSSASGNTQRFIEQLKLPAIRLLDSTSGSLPEIAKLEPEITKQQLEITKLQPEITEPFVLVCPTYADGFGQGAVPKAVIQALNQQHIRSLLRGVIASGNRNFGELFAHSGTVIAKKCNVPVLYRFELAGTPQDVQAVRQGLTKFWKHNGQSIHS
ncbi:class Ib ribonucleoside-diphosphate reductase assembly flavoprotein NrdI [Vibrio sp. 99-70-13A1]|uniref:class Ib ribonucleoside-diphosphate reductase assembly flavoprotein NrdI n=1 Tax=Vibrio sp. 99-70-13A1 TaxID=2607601 RepID=UPI0014938C8C|nr:class Ib ribonucleoside-diphosphate reductase assembly flavoprotein NrdI [Vibrio sp. 99-70-13A1]NOH97373.1 class Ib ribonucleoside-diphosphate reductase assembly flavoprotein NrdI [Vibrio sp. 99-70-13A1]